MICLPHVAHTQVRSLNLCQLKHGIQRDSFFKHVTGANGTPDLYDTNVQLQRAVVLWPNLTHLELSGVMNSAMCGPLSDDGLVALQGLQNLTRLRLWMCEEVTDVGVQVQVIFITYLFVC